MTFLGREVEGEERILMAKTCFETNTQSTKDKHKKKIKGDSSLDQGVATTAGLLSVKEAKSQRCLFCEENHGSSVCEKARSLTMDQRTKIVRDKRACFKCLKVGHSYKICYSKEKCPWCGKSHSLLMCRNLSTNNNSSNEQKLVC